MMAVQAGIPEELSNAASRASDNRRDVSSRNKHKYANHHHRRRANSKRRSNPQNASTAGCGHSARSVVAAAYASTADSGHDARSVVAVSYASTAGSGHDARSVVAGGYEMQGV
jgi:hypothetical protein